MTWNANGIVFILRIKRKYQLSHEDLEPDLSCDLDILLENGKIHYVLFALVTVLVVLYVELSTTANQHSCCYVWPMRH